MSALLPISGKRVVLRRLHHDDLPAFQAYRGDPEVGRYQGWLPMPDEKAGEFIATMATADFFISDQWIQLGIADKETDRLIGDVGLCLKELGTIGEIGFSLEKKSQGQGLAFEAVSLSLQLLFEQNTVQKVQGITDSRNAPSIHLLKCLGMTLIESIETEFRGSPCIEYLYSISRPEFENSDPPS